ncbi:hypothetical protein Dpoa2040_002671 [Dickeya sp. CFBP 2040]|uniref:Uncharacterized protein n=1 Tax=Dickeya poaceiphila TaxID=568768 RepID=A0A5B8I6V1_9GAMM|nr:MULTISPECIES: hypothetical protein [Dickeya]NKI75381.1 hypothetical protein [Dickeya sp. CFBP 2040]QDX28820.1 hypothetical protein Dpoa569_0000503 [Dickeya poaceiphila]
MPDVNIFLSSLLERQLHDAAVRSRAREATMSRQELQQKARALLDQLTSIEDGDSAQGDTGQPTADVRERLARVRQATAFANGIGTNPFNGLTYQQLSLIVYDDSGVFTLNERRAAWSEAYAQDQAWRQHIVTQARLNYGQPQWQIRFFTEVLKNYRSLPAIEKAQYPRHYERELQCHILPNRDKAYPLDFSSLVDYPSLLEMLLTIRQGNPRQETSSPTVNPAP